MNRLGFILTAPCSGGERIGAWLAKHTSVFVTENMLFGKFFEQWPTERGATVPAMTVDRFVNEWSRTARLALLGIDRSTFQTRFFDQMIDLIVKFGLEQSGREFMLDLLMPFPGTQSAVDDGLSQQRPQTPIVRLVRDGRDMVVDQAFRWLLRDTHGTNRYAYFVERRPNLKLNRFFDDLFLERWARAWRDAAMSNAKRHESNPLPVVTYEQWSSAPDQVLTILLEQFALQRLAPPTATTATSTVQDSVPTAAATGSSSNPATGAEKPTNLDRLMQRVRRIAAPLRTSIGGWTTFFTRDDGKLFHAVAGDALLRHGYVNHPSWFELLPEKLDPDPLEALAQSGDVDSPR